MIEWGAHDMNQHDMVFFFLQIGVMLAFALVFGNLMRRLHQPAILGELIGGILLGPTIFGMFFPDSYEWLFQASTTAVLSREAVVEIGMLFFLFVAGLEVNLSFLRKQMVNVAMTSLPSILVPFCFGVACVLLFPGLWNVQSTSTIPMLAIFMGVALSISALPIIARTLMDLRLINADVGVIIMGAATINDLIGWSLFAVILSTITSTSMLGGNVFFTLAVFLGLFILGLTGGRWAGQRFMDFLRRTMPWPSSFIGVAMVLVLLASAVFEAIGIHAFFGAFLVGVVFARNTQVRDQAHEVFYQFTISKFAPLYFVSLGLRADFISDFNIGLTTLILLIACAGKIGGASIGAWASGMSSREALAIGFGMNSRGAMELILASVALQYGLIHADVYVALVIMAFVTSMLSGPMMQKILGIKMID